MKKVFKASYLLIMALTLCLASSIAPSFAFQKQQTANVVQTHFKDNEQSGKSNEYTQQIIEQITADKFDKKTFSIDATQLADNVTIAVTNQRDYFVIRDNKIWGQYAIAEPTGQPSAYRQYILVNGQVYKVAGKSLKSAVKDSRITYQAGFTAQADKVMDSVAKQATQTSITYLKQSSKLSALLSSFSTIETQSNVQEPVISRVQGTNESTSAYQTVPHGVKPTELDNIIYQVPGGGLIAHEAAGGHLIARHVAKTEQELFERVANGQVKTASSFTDMATAEKIVSLAIEANRKKIQQYLSGSEHGYLVIEYQANYVIGISVTRGKYGSIKVRNARIILARDPRMPVGYKIITGYPAP
ncbi:hypothetical protein GCM10023211_06250 [Orbus sasakiae]|uniref:Bacterial CdiA-CT RNAse A domain-containing protein n=1 Tax=Orbus sasakiae TaxID=1078475 RepID=A0ABP9N0Z8_9GAMM